MMVSWSWRRQVKLANRKQANPVRYDQLDPETESRLEALLAQMTLAEKVGQLVIHSPFGTLDWGAVVEKRTQVEAAGGEFDFHANTNPAFEAVIREGRTGTLMVVDVRLSNYLQRLAVEGSRLHIPLLIAADVIHGLRTIFPIPLAEACSWDPDLVEQAERAAAEEASACGVNWVYSPVVDIARDPRWGRIAEGSGEDPFLGAEMARARVRGYQGYDLRTGKRIVTCPKHYAGYGAVEGGRDYNTVDFSERTLRDVHLPPFRAAFEAGAGSTMSSFNEIGGVPSSVNFLILSTILRDEWGWPGVVVSDYNAIGELQNHGLASNLKEAARLAIQAGTDIDMESGAYYNHLAELVEEGTIPMELVDRSVRRVLRLKFRLGLFEQPYTDESLAEKTILSPDFRSVALDLARESMVLLKNKGNLLPLVPGAASIALIGPMSDNCQDLLGTWAADGRAEDVENLLEALRGVLPGGMLSHAQGCSLHATGSLDLGEAVAAARAADVVILALGEGSELSGEAHSRAYLGLPDRQQELVDAIAALKKPLIAVLMCGRPMVVPRLVEQVDALLLAWHGGIRAGQAIADILFGAVVPSGRLTVSWPRTEGQIPVYYSHKNTGRPSDSCGTVQFHEAFRSRYLDLPNSPLFPFGFGLSYTRFEYLDLQVETPSVHLGGTMKVSALLKNIGKRAGTEVVQLYIRDLVGSVTRPVKELKGFRRISLGPSEEGRVQFELPVQELGFTGLDMRSGVEAGHFQVWIGPNAESGLDGQFEVLP